MSALGQYNATKFAVEGSSEALQRKVEPQGIQVMAVEPSGLCIDWVGCAAKESTHPIDDCSATVGTVRAVKAIIEVVAPGKPPHNLLLGDDAFEGAMAKVDELRRQFTTGKAVARGAEFPKAAV